MKKEAQQIVNKWLCQALNKNDAKAVREACIVLQATTADDWKQYVKFNEDATGSHEKAIEQIKEESKSLNDDTLNFRIDNPNWVSGKDDDNTTDIIVEESNDEPLGNTYEYALTKNDKNIPPEFE